MITEDSGRRFLALPAIQPCEGISPPTLLNALVTLSGEVHCYRSESFPVQKRNSREAIRRAGILLAFLEDVRDHGCYIRGSAAVVTSLSDLHVMYQKLRLLLHDCARRGGRLLLLMKSDRVSSEFRTLIRLAATALDVLLNDEIQLPAETKELGRLLERHAWKARVRTDVADGRAAREVLAVLKRFENRILPDRAMIKRVLEHLEIRSWSDCNEEISLLEEEIGNGGSETGLLSDLMGFMLYSRCVVFDVVNDVRGDDRIESWKKINKKFFDCLNLEDFRCPISLELMTDPVTMFTGQTYDRGSIVKWLNSGNNTCPVTGNKLENTDLVPNLALRNLIQYYFCHPLAEQTATSRRRSTDKNSDVSGSPAAAEAIRMVAAFLVREMSDGSNEERSKAIYELRLLGKSSVFNRACLVEAGAVPWLLHYLASWDSLIQDNSMAAVLNLSKLAAGREAIFESGGLVPIVDVLTQMEVTSMDAQQNAAATLFYLSSVEEYRRTIGDTPEAIPALIRLLRTGTTRGKKSAVVALFGLLQFPGNYIKVVSASDVVPNLIDILSTTRREEELVSDSLAVLSSIAEKPEGSDAVLRLRSTAIPSILVEILRSSASGSAKEYCISIFLSLCNNNGGEAVRRLDRFPSLMPSLYSALTSGSHRARKKARSLISILHRFHDQSSPPLVKNMQREHGVHVR